MKPINKETIKVFSSLIHGLLAAVVVPCLILLVLNKFESNFILLWGLSIAAAGFWGWKFGSWYIPMEGERLFFEPYVATPIITLVSALCSGPLFMFVIELSSSSSHFSLGSVLGGGLFIGIYAFILTLPITSLFGVLLALYLFKFGGYKYA